MNLNSNSNNNKPWNYAGSAAGSIPAATTTISPVSTPTFMPQVTSIYLRKFWYTILLLDHVTGFFVNHNNWYSRCVINVIPSQMLTNNIGNVAAEQQLWIPETQPLIVDSFSWTNDYTNPISVVWDIYTMTYVNQQDIQIRYYMEGFYSFIVG